MAFSDSQCDAWQVPQGGPLSPAEWQQVEQILNALIVKVFIVSPLYAVMPAAITFITSKCLKSKAFTREIDDGEEVAIVTT